MYSLSDAFPFFMKIQVSDILAFLCPRDKLRLVLGKCWETHVSMETEEWAVRAGGDGLQWGHGAKLAFLVWIKDT